MQASNIKEQDFIKTFINNLQQYNNKPIERNYNGYKLLTFV